MKEFVKFLIIALVASFSDAWSTFLGQSLGIGYEQNVVVRLLMLRYGPTVVFAWWPVEASAMFGGAVISIAFLKTIFKILHLHKLKKQEERMIILFFCISPFVPAALNAMLLWGFPV